MTDSAVVAGFAPVHAKGGEPMRLAMQKLWVVGRVLPAGARLIVRHMFRSGERRPLEVIYAFALPRDAALRRFRVTGKGFSVRSELKPVDEAVKAYEAGIDKGHLSALATQHGDGIVNLTLGNIQPDDDVTVSLEVLAGVEVHDNGFRFRFPFTLAPGYHPRARVAVAESGAGEIELPGDEFGDVILPQYSADPSGLHQVGFDLTVAAAGDISEVASPSHAIRVLPQNSCRSRVLLATEGDVPNRDLVLDIRTKENAAGVLAGAGTDGRTHFAAIVPSTEFGEISGSARRVVFVLDRSGSMQGAPLDQARRAVAACLGALSGEDRFGLLVFDDRVKSFAPALLEGSLEARARAREFLDKVEARGGTELAAAVLDAAALLGAEGGDIVVLTDGQVFGTERIIGKAREAGIRVHCLGIGSASQDRFLTLLARETGGASRFLTPRERVDLPAVDLFASIGRPVASQIEVRAEGLGNAGIGPEPQRAVFSGTPLVVFGDCDAGAEGRLVVEWERGSERRSLAVPVSAAAGKLGETVRLLHGARLITDLDSRPAEQGRARQREDRRLAKLSEEFGLASRAMALVAVVERADDRPGELPKTQVVPVGMPQDTDFSSYFQSAPVFSALSAAAMPPMFAATSFGSRMGMDMDRRPEYCMSVRGPEDSLIELASQIEPDGGMPGGGEEERILATILALLVFLSKGHTPYAGAFRSHVRRLIEFLRPFGSPTVQGIVQIAERGMRLRGNWQDLRPNPALWAQLERALEDGPCQA